MTGKISESPAAPGVVRALAAGTASAVALIAWDVLFRLPKDMNVVGLIAVPYYLVGAFFVEVVLHLIPLALWLGLVGRLLLRGRHDAPAFWAGAVLIAALEPVSQLGSGVFSSYSTAFFLIGAMVTYGVNFVQMVVLRRDGFAPMFAYRLGLYLLWHLIWGPIRLRVLF